MKNTLCIILLFIAGTTHAQNYNCLQHGPIHYFTNGDGYLRGIRIDSVRTSGSDTIYYPYRTIRGNYIYGATTLSAGASWLGKAVIKQSNGTFLFDNMWDDTVIVKTGAFLGETWMFFNDTSQIWYTATITAADTATVYGTVDSIKQITITAYSNGSVNTADPVNGFKLKLSKNNGFLHAIDLYTFPYHRPGSIDGNRLYFDYNLDLVLGELPHIVTGGWIFDHSATYPTVNNSIFTLISFYNPTMMEVSDMAIGDVLEYRNVVTSVGYTTTTLKYDSVLTKIVTPYNVTYTTLQKVKVTVNTPTGMTNTYSEAEQTYTADTAKLFDLYRLPEEWGQESYFHYSPSINVFPACKSAVYKKSASHLSSAYAELYTDFEGYGRFGAVDKTFALGYGQINNYRGNPSMLAGSENGALVYLVKNGTQCGTYQTVNVNSSILSETNNLMLYPNPAQDVLNISAPITISTLLITDIQGRILLDNKYSIKEVQIDIANYPAGMYFVKVNGTAVQKFIKQ